MTTDTVFLTGGTGFLGRHILAELCRHGYALRVLTRTPEKYPWLARYPQIEILRGDLNDRVLLREGVSGCRYVIHAGGLFRLWGNPSAFYQVNVEGTANMLEAASAAGVERFVHISTVAVIGQPHPEKVIDETDPARPAEPYQRSKLKGEQVVLRWHHEHSLPVIILRPGALYGPLGTYAFNRLFFRDPMRGIMMQINGGRYINFPAYVVDSARVIVNALQQGRDGEVYNICGEWISHREVFDIVCQEANLHWPRLPIPGWLGIGTSRLLEAMACITRHEPFWPINLRSYVYNYWRVSNEKAVRELGLEPTSFRDGARRTIAWYRDGCPQDVPEVRC